jgi:hypothetical protein
MLPSFLPEVRQANLAEEDVSNLAFVPLSISAQIGHEFDHLQMKKFQRGDCAVEPAVFGKIERGKALVGRRSGGQSSSIRMRFDRMRLWSEVTQVLED